MTHRPIANTIASILCLVVVTPATLVSTVFAGDRDGYRQTSYNSYSSMSAAEKEEARRGEYLNRGIAALEVGDRAYDDKDYEKAFAQYRLACDLIPRASKSSRLFVRALNGLCDSGVRLAEQRIAEGRYGDATNVLKTVLDDRYDPHCKKAIAVLQHLEEPDYYNKTITPKFRANVEQVKAWLVDAKGYYDTGRFDLAYKRCEQVLNIDPYNIGARKFQEEINKKRDAYAVEAYSNRRSYAMWQLDKAWELPVRRFGDNGPVVISQTKTDTGMQQRLQRKLETIIVPKLEMREATIREAIEFLKKKSVDLDTSEPDPSKRGVNIVLKLDSLPGAGVEAAPAAVVPSAPVIPGLEPIPGAAPAAAPTAPVSTVSASEARITVSLSSIPLGEALRYVTSLANLKYKVEQYAVAVVPASESIDILITKEWKVPPGFLTNMPNAGGESQLNQPATTGGTPGDASKGGSGISKRLEAKDYLMASGVTFPPGSSAIFLASSSRLIARNTQSNLDLIEQIVDLSNNQQPSQVEIESKFVEITQTNLKELSFDTTLGASNVPGSGSLFTAGGTSGNTPATAGVDFPLTQNGTPIGSNPISGSLRSGNLAISQNAVDALLFGVAGSSALAPALGSFAGVFTDPQFQIVIRALNQKKGVDLLSAPRVTTKSGQKAVIEIIREFRYPTEFEPPQIPQTFGNSGSSINLAGNAANGLGGSSSSFPVTPTTPTAFETRNTGVTLEVEPVVGPDGFTIDLNLVPQVVEFEGFINYGSPIQTTSTNILGQSITNIITPNVINQPIFSTRKVTTSVSVFDGQTVVLGGLIREDVQKTEDKIPFFGDIPLVGRLFRSDVEQHVKRNLVIFVSARLINPAGEPVHLTEETEEVVETIPSPMAPSPTFTTDLPLMPK